MTRDGGARAGFRWDAALTPTKMRGGVRPEREYVYQLKAYEPGRNPQTTPAACRATRINPAQLLFYFFNIFSTPDRALFFFFLSFFSALPGPTAPTLQGRHQHHMCIPTVTSAMTAQNPKSVRPTPPHKSKKNTLIMTRSRVPRRSQSAPVRWSPLPLFLVLFAPRVSTARAVPRPVLCPQRPNDRLPAELGTATA